ncbi:helix-turn-helix domain-containing protein [Spirillospora sp. NPDC047279]|uniref:PucR family transcriptional regulator n=1 Tax=Spirillospora sp. NPDC047279 TaxID=3155478 RepID=UPI0033D8785D
MPRTLEPGGLDQLPSPLPRRLATILRPELPSLAQEIIEEIPRALPEYDRPLQTPYSQALTIGVERALIQFVARVAEASPSTVRHDDTYRRLGRFEAHEGRSLDSLQAAYRIGAQVAWRRVMRLAARHDLSSTVTARLADALFAYMNELASLSLAGYMDARPAEIEDQRRRLLQLLLRRPTSASDRAIGELAELTDWEVPAEVTLVAVPPDARCVRGALDCDVLVDLTADEPHLLVPCGSSAGAPVPLSDERRAMLAEAFPDDPVAAGLTVPIEFAADSLRWARQALSLVETGILDDGPVISCEDHLVTLWLLSDCTLIDQVARRQLAGMNDLEHGQRERLVATLHTWLTTRGTAAEMAETLHVHPQTVRHRIKRLEKELGGRLTDPDDRFAIEIVLRAMWVRNRSRTEREEYRDEG